MPTERKSRPCEELHPPAAAIQSHLTTRIKPSPLVKLKRVH
uniref:Uncharacterized protein n=1 Tax=Anguilla anguilla TaxID=7936 RepID=A0A0E9W9W7_ANGAN